MCVCVNAHRNERREMHSVGYRLQTTIHWRPKYAAKRIHYGQLYKRLDEAALKLYARPGQADWIFRPSQATMPDKYRNTRMPPIDSNIIRNCSNLFWMFKLKFENRRINNENDFLLIFLFIFQRRKFTFNFCSDEFNFFF